MAFGLFPSCRGASFFPNEAAGEGDPGFGIGIFLACIILTGGAGFFFGSRRQMRREHANVQEAEHSHKIEKQYRELVETAFDLVYTHDLNGQMLSVSPSGARSVGYSPAEIIGMNISQLVAPDQLERAREMIAEKVRGTPLTSYELRLVTKNGQTRLFELISKPILEGGKIAGVRGIGRDISQRERAEKRREIFATLGQRLSSAKSPKEAAHALSEITASLFDWDVFLLELYSAERDEIDSILTIDTIDGKRIDYSKEVPLSKPSLRERRILENGPELILRDDPVAFSSEAKAIGNTRRPSASLLFAQIRSGAAPCGLLSIQSYKLKAYLPEDLQVLQALAEFCGEALVRMRAQEELRRSEERYRAVFEHAVVGICQTSLDGGLFAANPALARILGYASADTLVREVSDRGAQTYVDNETRSKFLEKLQRGEVIRGQEVQFYRRDQSIIWVGVSAAAVRDDTGRIAYIQAVIEDIMDRKRAEEEIERLRSQLLHIQKLESVGQLAAGVAHDFNNILTIIQGYASLLFTRDHFKISTDECLDNILKASERGASLTRHLLSFSRRQARTLQRLDLNAVLERFVPVLRRTIPETIAIRLESRSPTAILDADAGMLETIVMNLATNARDAMPNGGALLFRIESREIDATYSLRNREAAEGIHICLSVIDSGTGMDAAIRARIFEPFFTTKDVGQGTGLGLSAVYGIVKQHRGWIEVESTEGAGTTFIVFLPAASGPSPEKNRAETESVESFSGTETLLLVEDDYSLRGLTRKVLQSFGYRVIEARSGKEALAIWPKHSEDVALLLTDIVMPEGVSGGELAVRLKSAKPGLRVIFTTGYNPRASDSYFVFKEGINFIEKPYRSEVLGRIVRKALDSDCSVNEFRPELIGDTSASKKS
ncbi:MAG: PAS domain S-box protein [Verrucomicrobia bacterium]|nr:PAS domain S-box protein [Verrucomicrobiota bacterium]